MSARRSRQQEVRRNRRQVRRRMFNRKCCLCGAECRPSTRYCHAHSWAAE